MERIEKSLNDKISLGEVLLFLREEINCALDLTVEFESEEEEKAAWYKLDHLRKLYDRFYDKFLPTEGA